MTTDISVPLAALVPAAITTALPSSLPAALPLALATVKTRPRPLTNMFTAVRPGRYQQTAALTTVTTVSGVTTVQAGSYFSFQIGIPNLGAAFTAKVSYSMINAAGSDDVIALTPSGGSWSSPITVAVAAGGTSAGLSSETEVFTWHAPVGKASLARTDSPTQARALIAWRVQFPVGATITVPNLGSYYWWFENNAWPMMKSCSQAVAGVDTIANFTNTTRDPEGNPNGAMNPFYVGIKYTSQYFGKQILLSGDSIMEGLGGNPRFFGGVQRSACILSTPTAPIEWMCAAQHAQTPDVYAATMAAQITMVNPTAVFYAPYTINNITKGASSPGLTSTIKEEDYRGLAILSNICNAQARPPAIFVSEGLPNTVALATTAANDSLRQAFNTELASYGTDPVVLSSGITLNRQGITVIKGLAAAWSDPTAVNGQLVPKADAVGSDNTHPNETGYTRDIEPMYRPYLAAM